MRRLATKIFIEHAYDGLYIGGVAGEKSVLLIDSPLRTEDARDWLNLISAEYGEPRYMVLLDQHPDRVLGARGLEIHRVAHEKTRQVMSGWPDSFKGGANPIGSEADRIKRITGVTRAVPEISFADEMMIYLGDRRVILRHQPGPTAGAAWVVLPEDKTLFIGDAVTVAEPPYLGEAEIEDWLALLDELRSPQHESYRLISSRDGLVDREAVNKMARFLRKIPFRIERMESRVDPLAAATTIAEELLEDFNIQPSRRPMARLRLEAGLQRLFRRKYPTDE